MSERDNDYADRSSLPPMVGAAADLADSFGFKNSSAIVNAPLLMTLAAQVRGGKIAEMGTGAGVGTAWIASVASEDTEIITIEADEERSAAVRQLFASDGRVTVLTGDALEIAEHGPFDLIFCDAGPGKVDNQQATIAMCKPGGTILLDDLGPTRRDLDWWLECPDVVTATVWVTEDLGAILAVKR